MRLPEDAIGFRVEFACERSDRGSVYVEHVKGGVYEVWDSRPVRQGARHVEACKTFKDACCVARKRAKIVGPW